MDEELEPELAEVGFDDDGGRGGKFAFMRMKTIGCRVKHGL